MVTPDFAQLPDDVRVVPFYDQNQINFNDREPIWMMEVPGMPMHFWVLDMQGYIYSLYPKNGDYQTTVTIDYDGQQYEILDYEKAEILDFHDMVHFHFQSENGAYALDFHPDFLENGKFYIVYRANREGCPPPSEIYVWDASCGYDKIDEWIASGPGWTDFTFSRNILTLEHQVSYGTHCLLFGPDGYMWAAINDYADDGWDLSHLHRKLIRIDIDKKEDGNEYGIPPDNPYANSTDPNVKKEIWASGFRNGWQFNWDIYTGNLWMADVQQLRGEEFNLVVKGGNYGWKSGGDGQPLPDGDGMYGNCENFGGQFDCDNFEDPFFYFQYSSIPSFGDEIAMRSIGSGLSFTGDPSSPFYGHFIFYDHANDIVVAMQGTDYPQLIGDIHNWFGFDHRDGHIGPCHLTSDARGNIYAVFIGHGDYHLGRLHHDELIPGPVPVLGCTDLVASNYNQDATMENGTCEYLGCTNPAAENYNPNAREDDGSCVAIDKDGLIGRFPRLRLTTEPVTPGLLQFPVTLQSTGKYFLRVWSHDGQLLWEHTDNADRKSFTVQWKIPKKAGSGICFAQLKQGKVSVSTRFLIVDEKLE
jgi:hypothetical protein